MKIYIFSEIYKLFKLVWYKNKSFKAGIFLKYAEENIKVIKNRRIKEMAIKLLNKIKAMPFKYKVGNLYLIKKDDFIISTSGPVTEYIGFLNDGTLVAIYCAPKNPDNIAYFTNELDNLRNPKLESKNIIKYLFLEEGRRNIYLAVNMWDYFLYEYIINLQHDPEKYQLSIKELMKKIFLGLQVLHQAGVIHGDINPRNILIDSEGNVRVTGFGRSLKLEDLEATEILTKEHNNTKSSDIEDAGILVYWILLGGKRPFLSIKKHWQNTKYFPEPLQDIVAMDLVERMTNKEPEKRLTINEVLRHPYFWDENRNEEVIRKLGDQPEVQNYISISQACKMKKTEKDLTATQAVKKACSNKVKDKVIEMLGETEEVQEKTFANLSKMCDYAENYTKGKTFNKWKAELEDKWPAINIDKNTPEDLIGLLRCFRNKKTHVLKFAKERLDHFPDFFISLHRLAIDMSWDCTWS